MMQTVAPLVFYGLVLTCASATAGMVFLLEGRWRKAGTAFVFGALAGLLTLELARVPS